MNTTAPSVLPQRPLAGTSLSLSVAGLGTVKFGRNTGIKYPAFALPDDRALANLLAQAHEQGVNWLDTAPAYGSSEARLKPFLARYPFLISTKVGEEFAHGQSHFDFSAAHTRHSIARSCMRLGRDTLDIVMIHSDGNDMDILENSDCLPTLLRLKEQGVIRAVGMSCKTVAGALAAAMHCDILMLTLNPEYRHDIPAIRHAAALGKSVVIKKGLGSGHLADKYPLDSLAQTLFAEPITAVVFGTLNPTHLSANLDAIRRHAQTLFPAS